MPPVWLLTLVVKSGLTGKAAKVASWGIVAVSAILLTFAAWVAVKLAWDSHNEAVANDAVTSFGKDLSLDAANRVIEADRAASANATDAMVIEQKNEKELNDAVRSDSDATSAVLRRMREQQATGRR